MNMSEIELATSHVNAFSQVLTELFSQGPNFELEIKALALLSSFSMSWEVFCTTITNSSTRPMLDEAIRHILLEDLQGKSMDSPLTSRQKPTNQPSQLTDLGNRENKPRTGRNTNRSKMRGD
mgnify:CR=1 FL=1